jgi:hypothetical protein
METGRVGGWLTLFGCTLLLVAGVVAASGGAVSVGGDGLGGTVVTAAFALLAVGAGLLAASATPSLRSRSTRVGLALVSGGMIATVATSHVSVSSMLVVVYLVGGLVSMIGLVVMALGLLGSSGAARWIAITFLGGLALAIAALWLSNAAVSPDGPPSTAVQMIAAVLAVVGAAAMTGAVAGLGVLGVRAPRRAADSA